MRQKQNSSNQLDNLNTKKTDDASILTKEDFANYCVLNEKIDLIINNVKKRKNKKLEEKCLTSKM